MVSGFPFAERLIEGLGDWVHRSVTVSDAGFRAHRWFIGSRLTLGIAGLGAILLWMAMPAAFPRAVLTVGALLAFQLVTAVAVSRLGGLRAGLTVSLVGFAALPWLVGTSGSPLTLLPFILEGAMLCGSFGAGLAAVVIALSMGTVLAAGHWPITSAPVTMDLLALIATYWGALYWTLREAKGEVKARFSDDRWRTLSGLTDAGIVRHDESGSVIGSNALFCRLIGIDPDGLGDKTVITRLHLGSGPAFLKALSDVMHGAAQTVARVRIRCEEGAEGHMGPDPYRDFEIRFSRLVSDPVTGGSEIMACYRPMSEARSVTSVQPPASLEVARLGHELRTPLTAIIGFAECLGDAAIIAHNDPKRGDYARIIGTSARHMLDLVNSLPGAPNTPVVSDEAADWIDWADLMDDAVGIMRLTIEAQRARLSWYVDGDVPAFAGSRHAFRQVLINLISNALKFAPEGTVTVRATREGDKIRLIVEDNGEGVAYDDMTRLGEPYFRGSVKGRHLPEGQGLGLGIVRDIVQRHNGQFDIMSRPGAGTRVIVTLTVPAQSLSSDVQPLDSQSRVRRYA